MPDTKPPVPHARVAEIAEKIRHLLGLKNEQAAAGALLIRSCLQRIRRQPGPFADAETRRKIAADRAEAFKALEGFAEMLERQSKPSCDMTTSTEGES